MERKLAEWEDFLTETFSHCLFLEHYPRSSIDIFVEVMNGDGGVLMVTANAITLALIDAAIPMRDYLVACAAVFFEGQQVQQQRGATAHTIGENSVSHVCIDPSRSEESSRAPIMKAIMMGRSLNILGLKIERGLPAEMVETMTEQVKKACKSIFDQFDRDIVKPHFEQILAKREKATRAIHEILQIP